MKRLLILGTGIYQVPAILKAVKRNIEVIACSYTKSDPGEKYATHFAHVDITDKVGVLEVAKRFNIDGIMTIGSDVGVPTVGFVNDQLGLAGISEESAILSTGKFDMKDAFKRCEVNSPPFIIVSSMGEAYQAFEKLGKRVVFKSTDSSGSRGVIKVQERHAVAKAFDESFKHTKQDYIIVEEMISGVEFGAQCLVINKEVVFCFCHNDVVSSGMISTPIGHSYPFRMGREIEEKALTQTRKAITALKIDDAQLNCDFIIRDNDVCILEIGARIGATSLPQLTQNYSGLDWIQIAIDLSLGEFYLHDIAKHHLTKTPTASTLLFSKNDGIIKRIVIPEWIKENDFVTYFVMDKEAGDLVKRFRTGPDRIGEIVLIGDTLDDVEEKTQRFLREIIIEVK